MTVNGVVIKLEDCFTYP